MEHDGRTKVAVIGAGQEGLEILSVMRKDPDLSIMMLVDPDKSALGFRLGEYGYSYTNNLDLGLSHRFQTLSSIRNLSLVIDSVPGKYHKDIHSLCLNHAEIMNGSSAKLIWELKSRTDIEDKKNLISGQLGIVLDDIRNNHFAPPHTHAINIVSNFIVRIALLGTHASSTQLSVLSSDGVYKILRDVYTGKDLIIRKGVLHSPAMENNQADTIIRGVIEKKDVYQWESGAVIPLFKGDDVIAVSWLYYTPDNVNFTRDDISFIQSLMDLFGKSLQDALDAEKSRLLNIEERLMTEPSIIIRSEKPIEHRLNDINRTLHRFAGAEDSHIFIKDPATGDLVLQATTLKLPFLAGDLRIRNGAGILGEVMQRRSMLRLSENSPADADSNTQFAGREDAVSIIYIPLVARGEGVGVISMEFTSVHDLTPKVVRALEDAGQQIADTVSNDVERHRMSRKILKLYSVNEEGIEILSTIDIERITALSSSSSAMLLDAETAVLRLFEDDRNVVKSTFGLQDDKFTRTLFDIDHELSTTVIQTKVPVIIQDLSEFAEARIMLPLSGEFRYKSAMVIPVTYEREVLGTLSFYNKIAPEVFSSLIFSDDDREIAERFILYIARGIINARRYNEKQSLITIDSLTGLRNDRYLQMRFPEELKRAGRYNRSVSLMFLDVKPADDVIINDVARIVKETFRNIDVLVRLKEAKFAILLPDTGQTVKDAAVRIAASLGILREKRTGLAIYIGYSTYPYDHEDMNDLIRKASKLQQY